MVDVNVQIARMKQLLGKDKDIVKEQCWKLLYCPCLLLSCILFQKVVVCSYFRFPSQNGSVLACDTGAQFSEGAAAILVLFACCIFSLLFFGGRKEEADIWDLWRKLKKSLRAEIL